VRSFLNTAPSDKPGEHWFAGFPDRPTSSALFIDSYPPGGSPAERALTSHESDFSSTPSLLSTALQDRHDGFSCGYHTMLNIVRKSIGHNLSDPVPAGFFTLVQDMLKERIERLLKSAKIEDHQMAPMPSKMKLLRTMLRIPESNCDSETESQEGPVSSTETDTENEGFKQTKT